MRSGESGDLLVTRFRVSVVVNYYNPKNNPRIVAMTVFALECLYAYTTSFLQVIIVNCSGDDNVAIDSLCQAKGWTVLKAQGASFAQGYNRGMLMVDGDYRVWMANDIFVSDGWDIKLIDELRRTHAWMAAPYLTSSDYVSQNRDLVIRTKTFRPMSMTFNLNMVIPSCLEKVGLIDERFSGSYNDTDYLLRIRRAGGEAIIVDAGQIIHLGRATTTLSSSYSYEKDQKEFLDKYPEFIKYYRRYGAEVATPELAFSFLYRIILHLIAAFPIRRFRRRLTSWGLRCEPIFHKL